MGLNLRGGSNVMQYYASVNYNRDEGMLKTDRLNQFDCNIKNNTFTFRTNLNIDLAAGIRLLINTAASLDKYHGPSQNVTQAYALAFQASPVVMPQLTRVTSNIIGHIYVSGGSINILKIHIC